MSVSWEDLAAGLPVHADEVMASHPGQPAVAEQDRTHAAGLPAVDRGVPDDEKYAC